MSSEVSVLDIVSTLLRSHGYQINELEGNPEDFTASIRDGRSRRQPHDFLRGTLKPHLEEHGYRVEIAPSMFDEIADEASFKAYRVFFD